MISEEVLISLIDSGKYHISDILPSVWAEQNIMMPPPIQGPLRYSTTPYTREVIDRFAKNDPVTEIALMGSAQFGKTASIIIPLIMYLIQNNPGNIVMTVGKEELIEEAMNKIDYFIDSCGLRYLIRNPSKRAKSNKTGDTNTLKQFPSGYLKVCSASNPKTWQQSDYQFGLIDDYERAIGNSKGAGNLRDLIEKRFTAYAKTKKILYVSSPELLEKSNIYEVYMLGDQRKFLVPCPHCAVFIELIWEIEGENGLPAGITWELDENNRLIAESVGYTCQCCGGFFTDQNKHEIVNAGYWNPTAIPFKPEFTSYYMNSLYSPAGMDDWLHYVRKYLECNPPGGQRIESKYQTFLNLNLGLPYKKGGESIKAESLKKNIRNYQIGVVPEELSISDGNGKIVMLTCACDLNGRFEGVNKAEEHDARLDYEIVAHSENGSTYSISHGSIGTFIPRESFIKDKKPREKWTYEHDRPMSVWKELDKILGAVYRSESGKGFKILATGIDTGYLDKQVWEYIDKTNFVVRGLKGEKEDQYVRLGVDLAQFKIGKRKHSYLLQVGVIKDELAKNINLKWNPKSGESQPSGFMNYPHPDGILYGNENFFNHYEAEHRVLESVDGEEKAFIWKKKNDFAQNHLFDCRVYNNVIRDIFVFEIGREYKLKQFLWVDYVDMINKRLGK